MIVSSLEGILLVCISTSRFFGRFILKLSNGLPKERKFEFGVTADVWMGGIFFN